MIAFSLHTFCNNLKRPIKWSCNDLSLFDDYFHPKIVYHQVVSACGILQVFVVSIAVYISVAYFTSYTLVVVCSLFILGFISFLDLYLLIELSDYTYLTIPGLPDYETWVFGDTINVRHQFWQSNVRIREWVN